MSPPFLCVHRSKRLRPRRLIASACVLAVVALGGCAQVSVVRINSNEPASYALQGPHLAALQQEAAVRCPKGHEVHRQADATALLPPDWRGARWWNLAMERLDDDDRRAQLVVTCR